MPRHHPAELRRQLCERMLAAGRRPGAKSYEADPLLAARRRIKELEAELKITKAASALFEEGAVDPKGSSRLSED
jgi:transposase-like protein